MHINSVAVFYSHEGHVSELIRSQNEDVVNLKVLLNSSAYHQSRLQVLSVQCVLANQKGFIRKLD